MRGALCGPWHVSSWVWPVVRNYKKNVSTLDGDHTAAGPLTANIPQLPQDLLCCDHKAELLVRGSLLSTEVTKCGFFAAVATI